MFVGEGQGPPSHQFNNDGLGRDSSRVFSLFSPGCRSAPFVASPRNGEA